MRDLNDPENPYIDQYEPWDLWIFMHETSVLEAEGALNPWVEQPGWEYYDMSIDENGFAVPRLVELRSQLERIKHGNNSAAGEAACTHSISATGIMDPAVRRGMLVAEDSLRARYLPRIPEWLPQRMLIWAMILNSGEVITCEPADVGTFSPFAGVSETCCHRFSADGVLLDSTKAGQLWLQLFFDAERVMQQYEGSNVYVRDINGYLVVQDTDSGKQVAVYDMDGTRLPSDHQLDDRDGTHFYKLYASELAQIFEAQKLARGRST